MSKVNKIDQEVEDLVKLVMRIGLDEKTLKVSFYKMFYAGVEVERKTIQEALEKELDRMATYYQNRDVGDPPKRETGGF